MMNTAKITLTTIASDSKSTSANNHEVNMQIEGSLFGLSRETCGQEQGIVHSIIQLDHFNSTICKSLFDFLRNIQQKRVDGIETKIEWVYSTLDKQMLELGEDFSQLFGLDFTFVRNCSRLQA